MATYADDLPKAPPLTAVSQDATEGDVFAIQQNFRLRAESFSYLPSTTVSSHDYYQSTSPEKVCGKCGKPLAECQCKTCKAAGVCKCGPNCQCKKCSLKNRAKAKMKSRKTGFKGRSFYS
jgi:hypothetical protein